MAMLTVFLLVVIVLTAVAAVWWVFAIPQLPKRAASDGPRASAARLEQDVYTLVDDYAPRWYQRPDVMAEAAAWIARELEAAGAKGIEIQEFEALAEEQSEAATYLNVLSYLGPEEGARRLVVGAHYDVAGPMPGADDNASGIAGLLELTRMLAAGDELPIRVDLIAWANEEPPFFATRDMGSARHAELLADAGVEVPLMLSLEMLGYYDDTPGSQAAPLPGLQLLYGSTADFIAVAGRLDDREHIDRVKAWMRSATDLRVEAFAAPSLLPEIGFSDQRNYWPFGWPGLMITDSSFFRNDRYHTERDTPDSLDYQRMAKAVDGIHATVRGAAEWAMKR